jgi:hypothetical protein
MCCLLVLRADTMWWSTPDANAGRKPENPDRVGERMRLAPEGAAGR